MSLKTIWYMLLFYIVIIALFISNVKWYETIDLNNLWYWTWIANYMIQECNKIEWVKLLKGIWDSQHCIRLAVSIGCAESSCWTKAYRNNIWWFRNQKFKSQEIAFDRWIKSYKKYWHKTTSTPKDFYWKNNKHRYCVDEYSSNTIGRCPNGLKHSTNARNALNPNKNINEPRKITTNGTGWEPKRESTKLKNSKTNSLKSSSVAVNNVNVKSVPNKKWTKAKNPVINTTKQWIKSKSTTTTRNRQLKSKN
jgi:hypothetical protein